MRERNEFQIVGAKGRINNYPEWFGNVVDSDFTPSYPLKTWGDYFSTELREEELFVEKDDGFEEVSSRVLIVSDDKDEDEICVASSRYNLIQNSEIVEALVDAIEEMNIEVVGFVRDYKSTAVIDVYPVHNTVMFESPQLEDTMSFGVEVRIGHDKTESVKARPILRDSYDRSTVRGVGEWKRLKHVKPEDVDDKDVQSRMFQMFSESIYELGYMASTFLRDVENACTHTVDFGEEDFNIEEFYSMWLNQDFISESIVDKAPRKAVSRAGLTEEIVERVPEGETLDMWSIISGFTYAVSTSNMSDGYNRDRCHEIAAKAISNPGGLVEDIREEYQAEEEEEEVNVEEKAAILTEDLQG